jgi:hypothetical protein
MTARDPICKKACFRTMVEIAPFFSPTIAAANVRDMNVDKVITHC